ncbi:MAG: DUF4168 domain-containing protein [Mastigocoleus sp.]
MNKLFDSFSYKSVKQIVSRTLLFSTLVSTVSGGVIFFSSGKVYAQNFQIKSSEVTNYAKAVLAMEPARQEAYGEIKKVVGNVPNIVCNKPKSFSNLPRNAKDIAIKYCKRSKKIVESNGFSVDRFNKITEAVLKDESLKRKIYKQLVGIQRNRQQR